MMLADMVSELGHCIDGPYNRLTEAMSAARDNEAHLGVLDVNGGKKPSMRCPTYWSSVSLVNA